MIKRDQIREFITAVAKNTLQEISQSDSILISSDLKRCNKNKSTIFEFCKFCKDFLEIDHPLKIELVSNRDESNITTTAFYNPESHLIRVYCKDRAIADVCRSIAHEMTHMSQMLDGKIEFPVQDAGGQIEDEANSKAGEVLKLFAKSDPERKSIYESIKSMN